MGDWTGISDRPTTIAPLKAVLIMTVPQNSLYGPKVISYIKGAGYSDPASQTKKG